MQLMYTPATNFVFVGQWPVWTGFEQNLQVSFTAKIVPSPVSSRNQRDTRLFQAWFSWGWHHLFILDHLSLVGGLVAIFEIFPEILGMSSSQVTKSYFSEGWVYWPTNQIRCISGGWDLSDDFLTQMSHGTNREPWHSPKKMWGPSLESPWILWGSLRYFFREFLVVVGPIVCYSTYSIHEGWAHMHGTSIISVSLANRALKPTGIWGFP